MRNTTFSHVTFRSLVVRCAEGDEGYHIVLWWWGSLTCEYVTLKIRITTWHTHIKCGNTHSYVCYVTLKIRITTWHTHIKWPSTHTNAFYHKQHGTHISNHLAHIRMSVTTFSCEDEYDSYKWVIAHLLGFDMSVCLRIRHVRCCNVLQCVVACCSVL